MDKPLALVVEDDEDLALIFMEAVSAAGYEVETFYKGNDALARLDKVAPHLLVLDLHLPGVTGPDILSQIRSREHLKNMRVIIASADDQLAEHHRDQATLVLLKPVSMVQLRDLAQRLLKTAARGN